MTHVVNGEAVAAPLRERLRACVETLSDAGVRPGLATVLMSHDPADERYVGLKHAACEEIGIAGTDVRVDTSAPAGALFEAICDLNADPTVHGVFVQLPLPTKVDAMAVRARIDPAKDVDCLHPENLGELVAGNPRFVPATPAAIRRILSSAGVETDGADAVVVGRSAVAGTPMANLLLRREEGGNATVTVCHSRTRDLAEKTRRADVLVTAAGVPELIDGSMLGDGVAVLDASVNRVEREDGRGERVVGDVEFASAAEKASVITPVPGGVGPVTLAMLLYNTVQAAAERASIAVDLP